ncbi:MAG TPA: choice-of-anchor D domain-containing protein, partial [Terriglobales bacterium]
MYVITMRPAPVRKFAAQQSFHSSHNRFSSRSALLALLFVCISTLAITGCGGVVALSSSAASQSASTSNLVATPAAVDFGNVSLGSSATQKISLANKGSASAQISQLALSNTAFRVEGLGTLPVTVAAGSTLSLTVHFSPTSSSDSYDQLNVITSSSSSAAAKVNLHGKGESGSAEISGLTCDEAKFSGAGSDSCTIVTNMAARSGGVQVHLSSNNSAIKVPARVKVPEGASKVKFAATVSKVSSDEIGIITAKQGDDVRSFSISLSPGSGTVGTPELTLLSCDPTSFTGEGKAVCKASLSSATAKPLSVALASTNSAVSIPASATIAAGATAASFTASVSAVGNPQTATISATANGTSRTLVIQLGASKKSAGALTLSASSLQFGDVALGTATTKSLTITSSGNAPVNVKSDSVTGKGFSVSGGNFPDSLKPGQALVLTVHFNPTVAGSAAGQMTISSSAGDQTVSLSGNGTTATPTLSALSCSSSSVVGALADSCKVTLSGSAPKGGINVALASSSTSVQVPKSITIP